MKQIAYDIQTIYKHDDSKQRKTLSRGESKMLLEEFDMEEVKACWQKEAAEKASNRDGKLFDLLLSQKRYDDARKAATDSGYRMKLFEMYGI